MSDSRRMVRVGMVTVISVTGVLLQSPAQATYPGRDGRVAYVIMDPSYRHKDIWAVNNDGTGNRRLTSDGKSWHPRWSPDGSLLAFERDKDIYVMRSTGALLRRVTTTGRAHQPTWSPDGKRIAFVNVTAAGRGDVFVVNARGGAISRLTHDDVTTCGDDRPSWSPRGGQIVYHQRTGPNCDHNRILTVNVVTGAERVVTEDGAVNAADVVQDPDFAADGRHIVFMAFCLTGDSNTCGFASLNPVMSDLDGRNRTYLDFSTGTEGDYRSREVAAAPDGARAVVVAHSWPGEDPQETFLFIPGTTQFRTVLARLADGVGTITQPDWQPLP